jgi:ankyrin repeat protein
MDIINALLDAGVDLNPEMNFHRPNAPGRGRFGDNQISTATTPLFRAVQNNDLEVIQVLLAHGADPNINTMGYTAFLLAAGAGPGGRGGNAGGQANMQVLDLMIQHSADVNAKVTGTQTYSFNVSRAVANNEGTSALHEAARAARTDLVKYLLDHGAKPDLLDSDGKKPIDVAGVPRAGRGGGGAPAAAAAGQAQGQAKEAQDGQAKGDPAAPAAAAGVAPVAGTAPAGAGPGRGAAGRGGPGRGGANTAAVAEIRTMLEAAATKK